MTRVQPKSRAGGEIDWQGSDHERSSMPAEEFKELGKLSKYFNQERNAI